MSRQQPFFHRHAMASLPLMLSLLTFAPVGHAAPALNFSSGAQVWGSVYTTFTSPLLGDGSFTLNGAANYASWPGTGISSGVASVTYNIPTGPAGLDPVYDLVTSGGQYGMGYVGQAEVLGMNLRTQINAHLVDSSGAQVANSPNSSINANAYGYWNDQYIIAATAARPVGSYGAILVSITLDGHFAPAADPAIGNNGSAFMQIGSGFTDKAGVNYTSSFGIYASASDPTWAGSKTEFKKLLFQYGTPFSLNAYQYASASNNGSADFFNTGRISSIELPLGATLESGALQAGVGSLSSLYGHVTNAVTADDINTNWDFGNNGGGFTPPVPEPAPAGMLLAGLGVMGFLMLRRRHGA
jgi:hypothetical protein